jgi:hypothetical protein
MVEVAIRSGIWDGMGWLPSFQRRQGHGGSKKGERVEEKGAGRQQAGDEAPRVKGLRTDVTCRGLQAARTHVDHSVSGSQVGRARRPIRPIQLLYFVVQGEA